MRQDLTSLHRLNSFAGLHLYILLFASKVVFKFYIWSICQKMFGYIISLTHYEIKVCFQNIMKLYLKRSHFTRDLTQIRDAVWRCLQLISLRSLWSFGLSTFKMKIRPVESSVQPSEMALIPWKMSHWRWKFKRRNLG